MIGDGERLSQRNYIEMVATFEEEIKKLTKDLNEKDHMLEYSKQVLNTNNEALAEHLKMELGQNNQLEATLKKGLGRYGESGWDVPEPEERAPAAAH